MDMRSISLLLFILTLGTLTGCQRAPAAKQEVVAPPPPPPPAKNMVMVCRNSRTGEKAACGTPDAVMVGMKPE